MHPSDVQETWAAVTFLHDGKQYTLKRSIKYTCTERHMLDDGTVDVILNKHPDERLSLDYLQADGQTKTPIMASNINESIDRVLPKDFSDYFFFGGERIAGIANRTDLSKAIRGLLRLDVLENARTHVGNALKYFKKQIDTSGDAKAREAQDGLETCRQQLETYKTDKRNADSQMQYWSNKESEYNAALANSDVERVKKAKAERDRLQRALVAEKSKLENAVQDMVTAFNNRPYAFFGMPAIRDTLLMLDRVKDTTECVPGMNQDAIDYMLHRGFCVCGTRLDPNSVPLQRMMEERRKLPPEHIGSVVMNYKNKAEGYLAGNDSYLSILEDRYKAIRTIQRNIGDIKDAISAQAGAIVDDSKAKQIEVKRKESHENYLAAKDDYEQASSNCGNCEANIRNYEDAIDRYAKSSTKNKRVARLIEYAEAVFNWLDITYREKESTVRGELQKRVNENFSRMYHGERAIEIDEKYRVRYADVKTEESDGLKAVKSFAFIASLVSLARDKIVDDAGISTEQVYPLVMDAPFSNVDEIHIDNICQILPRTANQVIMAVMQKDWVYAAKNLQAYVGASYVIMKDKDSNGREIDTSTHIVPAGD